MKALIVGAGAVGQVYGQALQRSGAEVAYLVKPKYAAAARAGYDLYPLNRRRGVRREPVRFEGFRVLESSDEVARETWDLVLLTVSSTALRDGTWLAEVARASGDATFAMLQPGSDDRALVLEHVAETRLLQGLIGSVSYQAPLPGEVVPRPGVAYWLPPIGPATSFGGPATRVAPLVEALTRGGLRAAVNANVARSLAFAGAPLQMTIIALECAGWSFAALRRDRDLLPLAVAAARDSIRVSAARLGTKPPLFARLLRPWVMRLLTRLAPRVLPFDFETYLRVHFTKVGDQTALGLATEIRKAGEMQIDVPALRALSERLERARAVVAPVALGAAVV